MLRQRQAAKSVLSIRSLSNSALPARRPSYLQPLSQSIKPFPPRLCQRYSSTQSEGAEPKKEATTEENGKEKKPEAEDPAKRELEAAKKEIVDLKVWTCLCLFSALHIFNVFSLRLPFQRRYNAVAKKTNI